MQRHSRGAFATGAAFLQYKQLKDACTVTSRAMVILLLAAMGFFLIDLASYFELIGSKPTTTWRSTAWIVGCLIAGSLTSFLFWRYLLPKRDRAYEEFQEAARRIPDRW